MKTRFKISPFILMLFLSIGMIHANDFKGRHTKEKTIKKTFEVRADGLLKIDNSYGNLVLNSWDRNEIVIEVKITTNGNNEDKVQKKLDQIEVDFESNSDMVSAKTRFDKNNSWSWWGKNNNVNMQINYTISLPVKHSVHLSNDYGNITLDRIDGHAKISCDYGRLDLGELRGRGNQLSFDYTSKSQIGYMNSGSISADYSGFTIEKAGDLRISADYTNSSITSMGNLEYNGDYGNLEVGEVANIDGSGDYLNTKFGTVHGNVEVTADYGSIRIERMAEDAGNLDIQTDYTGVKIGYDPDYHFDFEINTKYAGVKGKDDLNIAISKEKDNERYYRGYHGSEGSGKMVRVNSKFGSVSFNRN